MAEIEPEAPALLVCVLIVTHNCEAALRKCLEALERSREREAIEVLVVDNGSQDGCATIDSEFPSVTVLRLPHHFGLTKARNIGIRTAKAECLLLLSPDVLVEPDTVTALARGLSSEPSALAVSPLLVDESGSPASRAWRLPAPEAVKSHWLDPYSVPAGSIDPSGGPVAMEMHDGKALLIRKQAIQGINYLDEKYGETWIDAELAWQIRRAGRKILLLPSVTARLDAGAALWKPTYPFERVALASDAAAGAIRYVSKQAGGGSALLLQVRLALIAFLKIFTFSDLGYNLGVFSGIASGARIDGTDQRL